MQIVELNIGELKPYKENPRINDNAIDAVAASIAEFGFKVPIIIDKDNVIIAGHTRLKAARKLGLESVPVIRADDLTPDQVKAFRLADNKTAELAEWDFEALEAELSELADFDMAAFGFDIDKEAKESAAPARLADRFIAPPFDILDGRSKEWLERKRVWNEQINDVGQARITAKAFSTKAMNGYKGNGVMKSETSLLDPVLCEIILKWFTPFSGCACFDCFAGDTAFGYVAGSLGYTFKGIELRQEQADFNNEHTRGLNCEYTCDDGRNINRHVAPCTQDLFFSCPPYYNLEVYSDLPNDASNQKNYLDFYKIIDEAFTAAAGCLRDNRFAVIVAGDIRDKKGEYYNFPGDIIATMKKSGLALYNNIKLLTPIGNAQIRAARYMEYRKVAHVYQDVLVFFKGNTKQIKGEFENIGAEYEGADLEF